MKSFASLVITLKEIDGRKAVFSVSALPLAVSSAAEDALAEESLQLSGKEMDSAVEVGQTVRIPVLIGSDWTRPNPSGQHVVLNVQSGKIGSRGVI